MAPDIAPVLDRPAVCRGAGALSEALNVIGAGTDHDVAKIFCDNEMELRAMLKFVFAKMAAE